MSISLNFQSSLERSRNPVSRRISFPAVYSWETATISGICRSRVRGSAEGRWQTERRLGLLTGTCASWATATVPSRRKSNDSETGAGTSRCPPILFWNSRRPFAVHCQAGLRSAVQAPSFEFTAAIVVPPKFRRAACEPTWCFLVSGFNHLAGML